MQNMGAKIVAEAARRMAPTGGTDSHRLDLYLADHRKASMDASRVLIGWAPNLEIPCIEAVENWVLGQFNGMVRMEHKELRYHPQDAAISCIVAWMAPTRRMGDATKMAKVSPGRFLEAETKQVWEVRNADDGTPYLMRTTEEDLEALLSERKAAAQGRITSSRAPRFQTLKDADGFMQVDVGDEVKFHYKGLFKQGRVQRFDGDYVFIESGKHNFKVAAPAISEVVTKDPKTVGDYKSRVRSYWSKIFPKEYLNKWLKAGEFSEDQDPQ
jgi:hypothetical protein